MSSRQLRVAMIHPDLGIGGAERLVVDAALGLQKLGYSVDVYTSHHDPDHCFEETRDGRVKVHHIQSLFPRSIKGRFHILCAHARQLELTRHLIRNSEKLSYDVYFVDQLSTCVPFLRTWTGKRVVFYCHFPDKLLADGAYVEGRRRQGGVAKRMYRLPMDLVEETTTRRADVILANSRFTARVFKSQFTSIRRELKVVYPGINISAYETPFDENDPDVLQITSRRPTLISLNRFEKKKNAALAVEAFSLLKKHLAEEGSRSDLSDLRLILAGGYDPRLEDNMMCLAQLLDLTKSCDLSFAVLQPSTSKVNIPPFNSAATPPSGPDVAFLLNFTSAQRSALLKSTSTLAMLYTPTNEHFGIGPVEGMISGLPVLATNTGGPTESVVDPSFSASASLPSDAKHHSEAERTGWLRAPDSQLWSDALYEIISLSPSERSALAERAQSRARELFGMDAMAEGIEAALLEAVGMGTVPEGVWSGMWIPFLVFIVLWLLGRWTNS